MSSQEFDALERMLVERDRRYAEIIEGLRRLLDERDERYDQRFEAQEKAIIAALRTVTEANSKFETQEAEWRRNANEWRDAMGDRENEFVKQEMFNSRMGQSETDRKQLREDIGGIRQDLATAKGRSAAYAGILAVALVIVPILISYLLRGPFN